MLERPSTYREWMARHTRKKQTNAKSSVLAVGAHPDDIEVGCFGTLLKHRENGDQVVVVITTSGGYGKRSWSQIKSEAREASKILGVEYIIFDNKIGHYRMTWKTVSELDEVIARFGIETIYTVWHGDSHQDHQMTFRNVLAAARTKQVSNLYCFELPDYSYRSQGTFEPRRFVDITEQLEMKLKAVAAYKSYFGDGQLGAIRGLARHRGGACGVEHAEAFESIFSVWK